MSERPSPPTAIGCLVILYACLGAVLGQAGLFIDLPSLPELAAHFRVSNAAVQNSITVYAVGHGLSRLVWGPLSDRCGRRPISLAGLGLFALASLVLAASAGFVSFLLLLLLQGIGAGCCTSVSRASLRDVFEGRAMARAMSTVSLCFAGALGFAPFAGGLNPRALGAGYVRLLGDGRFLLPAAIAMLATGMIAFYDAVSPFVFEQSFGIGRARFGVLSLSLTAAYLAGALVVIRWVVTLGQARLLRSGLLCVLAGSLLMLLLGLGGRFEAASLLLPMLLIVAGCGQIIPIGLAMPMQSFPQQAGQASALTGFLQQEGSGLLVFLATGIPANSQVPLGAALLAIACALAFLVHAYRRLLRLAGA